VFMGINDQMILYQSFLYNQLKTSIWFRSGKYPLGTSFLP
jgi:hypothetical protein